MVKSCFDIDILWNDHDRCSVAPPWEFMQKIYDRFYPEYSQKSFHILCMRVQLCCIQYHVTFTFLIMASHCISRYCMELNRDRNVKHKSDLELIETPFLTLIARFMGPTWGPSGADRGHLGPISGLYSIQYLDIQWDAIIRKLNMTWYCIQCNCTLMHKMWNDFCENSG